MASLDMWQFAERESMKLKVLAALLDYTIVSSNKGTLV